MLNRNIEKSMVDTLKNFSGQTLIRYSLKKEFPSCDSEVKIVANNWPRRVSANEIQSSCDSERSPGNSRVGRTGSMEKLSNYRRQPTFQTVTRPSLTSFPPATLKILGELFRFVPITQTMSEYTYAHVDLVTYASMGAGR